MNLLTPLRKPFSYSFSNATLIIISINVVTYFLFSATPLAQYENYMALSVIGLFRLHMFWQPVTYMFMHGSISHLFFNMLALVFFGINTEKAVGTKEFLLLYFLCGVLCGIISVVIYFFTGYFMLFLVGASGAIYAILLAYAVIFPRSRIFIWGILPVPAPILVIAYAVIELGNQLLSQNGGVAHLTHFAGFVMAWLYFKIRMDISPVKIWKDAYGQ
ncbi:MAG: rhomboid family intramembrane serine protease [Treponema sp.]|nr:rhomboid family intramembrane serine protease [Treponema sp.]